MLFRVYFSDYGEIDNEDDDNDRYFFFHFILMTTFQLIVIGDKSKVLN